MIDTCKNPPVNYVNQPQAQFVLLNFVGGVAVSNQPVKLNQSWTRCFKVGTGGANVDGITNVFLHFQPINPNGAAGVGFGNAAGLTPNAWPLERITTGTRFVWRFPKGLPQNVFISADAQAQADHQDLICFCNDDIEMEQISPV